MIPKKILYEDLSLEDVVDMIDLSTGHRKIQLLTRYNARKRLLITHDVNRKDGETMESKKAFTIMMKDIEVMRIDFNALTYEVINENCLPYTIKGKLQPMLPPAAIKTSADMTQAILASRKNEEAVVSWLANRVLLLSRANAKWIYNLFQFEQVETNAQRIKIALTCRAASVKAWRRHDDGQLWLYKLGANGNTESRIEVMCSNLLDKMNVDHVHYETGTDDGKYVCMCPCMTTEKEAILTGMEFYSYCNVNGIDPDAKMFEIDGESIYKMWIVDFLISNRNRHGQNWGFFMIWKPWIF